MLYLPVSSFQHLLNPMWPHKHVPKRKVQPPTMKQGPSTISHEYKHSKNNFSGGQSLQVLNYLLVTSTQTSGISQLASQYSQRIPPYKWVLGPLLLSYYTSMSSLQLCSMLNRVITYCPTLWTRE